MSDNPQKTQPIKATKQERTQPIETRAEKSGTPQAAQPTEEVQPTLAAPDWLIAFASQKGSGATPLSAKEDTREIQVSAAFEPSLPQADTQPIRTALAASTVAASTVASAWSSEPIPSSPTSQEQGGTPAEEPTQPLEVQHTLRKEVPFREIFTEAVDAQQYTHALELLEHYHSDAATRSEALRILRSRLTLHPASRPFWEIYAALNAQENQPALADKALQTAEYLRHLEEE
jgi:hypothetical protein